MATIHKRGPYQWQVKIRHKGHRPLSKTFDTRADADAWAHLVEGQIARGEWLDRTEGERTLLGDALTRYSVEITTRKAEKAQKRELSRINNLKGRAISRIAMARVRGADISELIQERKLEGAGSNAIRLDLSLLSHVFTIARSEWRMEYLVNPVQAVRGARPRLPNSRTRRLEPGEELQLLAVAKKKGKYWHSLIVIALETAMRRGELADLNWRNIDLKERVIHLPMTKNHQPRDVPLSPKAVSIFLAIPRRFDGLVFGVKDVRISKMFGRITRESGCENLHFHDLRHEATSRLFERGYRIDEVKTVTGHKNLAMLSRYTHIRASDIARKMALE